jgi:hypothetical protein
MSSVLHPVGPEPERTYWVRRIAVVATVAVALSVLTAMFSSGDEQQRAVPAATTATPTAQPTADATSTVDAATPVDGSVTPPMSVSTSASSLDRDATVTPATETPTATAKPKPTSKSTSKATKTGPAPCDTGDLRATLRGDQSLAAKQRTTFRLSLINGGPTSCVVEVDADSFELRVYSGIDRIWTTDHCTSAVKPIKKVVKSEAAVQWSITWNGRRSAPDCKNRPEIPQAGTYVATAQLDGAKPVSLVMALKG